MTLEQEELILDLYKQGYTYKELWEITKIPSPTVASFMGRKHKNLIKLRELSRTRNRSIFIQNFVKDHGIPEYQAHAIFDTMQERFDNKRQNARQKGQEFKIKFTEIVIPFYCPLLGIPLNYFSENNRADDHPSFDRINNNKGYLTGNVQIVSWRGNRLKNDGTSEEHRKIADFLDKHKESIQDIVD